MIFRDAFQGRAIVSHGTRLPLGRPTALKVTLDTLRTGVLANGLATANPGRSPISRAFDPAASGPQSSEFPAVRPLRERKVRSLKPHAVNGDRANGQSHF
jgi:hypothetical protein